MSKNIKLSVIILNYNTKELLEKCLESVKKCEGEVPLQVIVSDNASSDGSSDMVREKFPWAALTEGPNEGFSKGNNRARLLAKGDMVLFLNPDTVVNRGVLKETTDFLMTHKDVGALTCKLILPDGSLDKDTRRRFPTPWISFNRLILKNGYKYWYLDVPDNVIQEVDAIQGAFFLTRKKILNDVGWFDEDYFFNGEDIDLCWKIRQAGWKIIYYPDVFIYHLKGVTSGKSKLWKPAISLRHKIKVKLATVEAMEIFFRKRLFNKYPKVFSWFVILGIKVFKVLRLISTIISSLIK